MLIKVIMMSLFCYGVYTASAKGMILEKIASFTKDKFGYWNKPLFGCIYCMSSFWGSISYVLIQMALKEPFNVYEWLILIVCAISMNGLVYNTIEG